MKLKITLASLTLASLSEFLLAYPVQATIQPSEKQIEIISSGGVMEVPFEYLTVDDEDSLDVPRKTLETIFEFISPGDESVAADWNLHVKREKFIDAAPKWIKPLDEEYNFGAKEKFILEINEERPEPIQLEA